MYRATETEAGVGISTSSKCDSTDLEAERCPSERGKGFSFGRSGSFVAHTIRHLPTTNVSYSDGTNQHVGQASKSSKTASLNKRNACGDGS